ncbi:hypothetical protein [Cupriavidus plantarum]|uniref:Uncharacterized protein n=1 Tax=Cupriavidus plantarum TaxID=942865 RepID=A0A316F0N1_9BURK|nr:hypothetical protein [Cupriavidus plantarum]PWK37665.1 hypothetical protein C7419_1011548 [Cupriavidus plantarum]
MSYLLGYFGLGLCFLLIAWIMNRLFRSDDTMQDRLTIPGASAAFDFMEDAVIPVLAVAFIMLCWPLAAWWIAKDMAAPKREDADTPLEKPFAVVQGDLVEFASVAEIEMRELVDDPLGAAPRVPFGHLHKQWVTFRNGVCPGDVIWSFAADRTDTWGLQRRRRGYVCVRGQEIGPFVVTSTQRLPLIGEQ